MRLSEKPRTGPGTMRISPAPARKAPGQRKHPQLQQAIFREGGSSLEKKRPLHKSFILQLKSFFVCWQWGDITSQADSVERGCLEW